MVLHQFICRTSWAVDFSENRDTGEWWLTSIGLRVENNDFADSLLRLFFHYGENRIVPDNTVTKCRGLLDPGLNKSERASGGSGRAKIYAILQTSWRRVVTEVDPVVEGQESVLEYLQFPWVQYADI